MSEPVGLKRLVTNPTLGTKVPEITVLFWVTKIASTGMGESVSDALVKGIGPGVAIPAAAVLFFAALYLQFRTESYVPWVYWVAVVMVAVFGTMAADVLHVGLGVPYDASTAFFAVVLAAVLVVWHRTEGTLSIHSVNTSRRELFYWLTVMSTFALGTAAGDFTAVTLGLGFLASGVVFALVIAVPWAWHAALGRNEVATFWFAYIITRPLGASFADYFAVSPGRGGLGWGYPVTAVLSTLVVAALIAWNQRVGTVGSAADT